MTQHTPTTTAIPRRGRGTGAGDDYEPGGASTRPAVWSDVEALLLADPGTSWLSVRSPAGVHTRPVFTAWTGTSFVLASNPRAAKTGHLHADGRVSLAVDLSSVHLVVEGAAVRLTEHVDLERAAGAMQRVHDWPVRVAGGELDAPYAAPTSGGPPFLAYEVAPRRAYAFPTDDEVEPTRFTW